MGKSGAKKIAVIGGGASALFILAEFVSRNHPNRSLDIFDGGNTFGAGMPYSPAGAGPEHMTNVTAEEIPEICLPLDEWVKTLPDDKLRSYDIKRENITKKIIVPRLLFGEYLQAQYHSLLTQAEMQGQQINIHAAAVTDIKDAPQKGKVTLVLDSGEKLKFDHTVIATGHEWKQTYEGQVQGYFDSPYPPKKLRDIFNHTVGIRGSSLTAIDAIKSLAVLHGHFEKNPEGTVSYVPDKNTEEFRIVMHSRQGLLPCIRFHFENPRVLKDTFFPTAAIKAQIKEGGGTVSLDFLFEKAFKLPLKIRDREFYDTIKDMSLEEFVDFALTQRQSADTFAQFEEELALAKESLVQEKCYHWQEMIDFFMTSINFAAKYMPAEDLVRVKKKLAPLASYIVAYLPHDSAAELIALHKAGKLDIVKVGHDTKLVPAIDDRGARYSFRTPDGKLSETQYKTFIDCTGQTALPLAKFPFPSLVKQGAAYPAKATFGSAASAMDYIRSQSGGTMPIEKKGKNYSLTLPGVAIDDNYRLVDKNGTSNPRISIMAVPLMAGHNPCFPALDLSEDMASLIMDTLEPKKARNEAEPIAWHAPSRQL